MNAKQTAEELTNKFRVSLIKNSDPMNMTAPFNYSLVAKQCALICVDEIVKQIPITCIAELEQKETLRWAQVRMEIEKM